MIIFGLIGAVVVGCIWMLIERPTPPNFSAVYVQPTPASEGGESIKININKAGPQELQRLPRIGPKLAGTSLNVAQLQAGVTWAISKNTLLDCTLNFGLTEDSPDITVEFRLPLILKGRRQRRLLWKRAESSFVLISATG